LILIVSDVFGNDGRQSNAVGVEKWRISARILETIGGSVRDRGSFFKIFLAAWRLVA
jgi:hypothetical protein